MGAAIQYRGGAHGRRGSPPARALPVAAHAHSTSSIRACVEAGVDTIEHCTWLSGPGIVEPDEQTVADIVTAGIAVCTANCIDWRPFARKYGAQRAQQIIGRVRWMAADAIGLATTAGTLHASYSADLLVVDGDPLADLTALQRPTLVLARGRPHTPTLKPRPPLTVGQLQAPTT